MSEPVTQRWVEGRCYNPRCSERTVLQRCHYYGTCGHVGCREHLPAFETGSGLLRLCGECRLLRAVLLNEAHLMGLSTGEPVQETRAVPLHDSEGE